MKTHYVPAGYHQLTPYLIVNDATAAIAFYKNALGGKELMRMPAPGGKVGHAEIQLGDSRIMLADEFPECDARSPHSIGGTPVSLMLYVQDVDAVVAKALSLGAKILKPIEDQFYGDRSGTFVDPFGHKWTIATHIEDVSEEEGKRRAAALFGDKK